MGLGSIQNLSNTLIKNKAQQAQLGIRQQQMEAEQRRAMLDALFRTQQQDLAERKFGFDQNRFRAEQDQKQRLAELADKARRDAPWLTARAQGREKQKAENIRALRERLHRQQQPAQMPNNYVERMPENYGFMEIDSTRREIEQLGGVAEPLMPRPHGTRGVDVEGHAEKRKQAAIDRWVDMWIKREAEPGGRALMEATLPPEELQFFDLKKAERFR